MPEPKLESAVDEPVVKAKRFDLINHLKNAAPFDRFLYALMVFSIVVMIVGFIGQQLSPRRAAPQLVPRPGTKQQMKP